ncbi:MAG: glycine cleavage system aminomethyltransferase GcvT [Pirellulaceae bacterium]
MAETTTQTPLYDWHVARQARMVDFAGWSMPIQYRSIIDEHQCTRNSVGIFDISHMGRLRFDGPDAGALIDRLVTRRVDTMRPGRIRYALMTNESGGILDDLLVYHLQAPEGGSYYQLVVNAGNREKIVNWLEPRLAESPVQATDVTMETAMIAIQGPQAIHTVASLVETDIAAMKYYTGTVTRIGGQEAVVSRTGYTGEDGCELIVPAAAATEIWDRIMQAGRDHNIQPVGLGARDTLRLEAAMPLYGHELSEHIDPLQAGLDFAVQLEDRRFVGREALVQAAASPRQTVRIGLLLSSRRVARQHCPVLSAGETVGEVTSGTFSPTLEKPIAMAYVRRDVAAVGNELVIDIRGRQETATVVELPFYTRSAG